MDVVFDDNPMRHSDGGDKIIPNLVGSGPCGPPISPVCEFLYSPVSVSSALSLVASVCWAESDSVELCWCWCWEFFASEAKYQILSNTNLNVN